MSVYEEAWYLFQSAHHTHTHDGEEFYGVFLANEYVLNINDPNVKGFPVDATELIEWLIESAKRVVSDLEKGIYNQEVMPQNGTSVYPGMRSMSVSKL